MVVVVVVIMVQGQTMNEINDFKSKGTKDSDKKDEKRSNGCPVGS